MSELNSTKENCNCLDFCIVVTDHLEAQRALIKDLTVVNMTTVTENADIAYHLNLTESARRRPDLEEGDVIAFMGNAKTGQTEIEKLSHENSGRAVMAGVISRSAYIYAHAPRHDVEKGKVKNIFHFRPPKSFVPFQTMSLIET